jgi:hypothetical protein
MYSEPDKAQPQTGPALPRLSMTPLRALSPIAAALTIALAAGLMLPAGPARAKTLIQGGFVSGKAYLDMPNLRKIAYVTGLLEGMFLAPKLGGDPTRTRWLAICADSLGRRGMRDVIETYLVERNRSWNNRNPAKMYRAIAAGCRAGMKPSSAKPETRRDGGYITGREYLDMNGLQKKAYVGGLVEGVLLAPAFGVDAATIQPFVACIDRLNWQGVRKAINAHLLANASLWTQHDPAARYRAIIIGCGLGR